MRADMQTKEVSVKMTQPLFRMLQLRQPQTIGFNSFLFFYFSFPFFLFCFLSIPFPHSFHNFSFNSLLLFSCFSFLSFFSCLSFPSPPFPSYLRYIFLLPQTSGTVWRVIKCILFQVFISLMHPLCLFQ